MLSYIFPPRPKGNIPPDGDFFTRLAASKEWIAQAKLNGMNCQLVITKDSVEWRNRHRGLCRYTPTPEQVSFIETLKPHAPLILNLELLDKQTKSFKKTLFIYDVLVFRGEHLLGSTVAERQKILDQIIPDLIPTQFKFALQAAPGVWRAKNFIKNWSSLFQYADVPIFEGLILKKLDGELERGLKEENNGGWSIRCRKKSAAPK